MKMKVQACLAAAASLAIMSLPAMAAGKAKAGRVCDVKNYGAKGDGTTKDTKAIQDAINDCAGKGGGIVTLQGGTFVSAPILLKNNITLNVVKGATLLGSPDHDDYARMEVFRAPGRMALVTADHVSNIAITGGGTIDGNGESWWREARATPGAGIVGKIVFRPRLVVFNYCHHIRMEGITVQNSPSWQIVPYYSDGIVIRNIKVLAPAHSPNTDAIDPFSSSNIVISHVYADVGDDDIAIKSGEINSPGPDSPSRNITITDCNFDHGHGLSIGSEIAGGAQNIHAERIHFKGTDQGIRIKAARDRGNDVSNISYKDITMEDVKTAILITEYYPHPAPEGEVAPAPITHLTPKFHNITITNVTATNSGSNGIIVGLPESPVTHVVMNNVHLSGKTGMSIAYADVTMHDVTAKAENGEPMKIASTAKVVGYKK